MDHSGNKGPLLPEPHGCPFLQGRMGALSTNSVPETKENGGVRYGDYLRVDDLLQLQVPRSAEHGKPVHDEHFFIVIHQVYELWFKQMLHDLSSICSIFQTDQVPEKEMLVVVNRLERIVAIQKILIEQIGVLETMTALDFLDFRDYVVPASGFQSKQFRAFESLLGLRYEQRTPYGQQVFWSHFPEKDANYLKDMETKPSFFQLIEKWLERTPGSDRPDSSFWTAFQTIIKDMLSDQRNLIAESSQPEEAKQSALSECQRNESTYKSLFDPVMYEELRSKGERRLSHKAMKGAVMIFLYRDEPRFHLPFKMMTLLMDVDTFLSTWRYQHALMVRRMIGTKVGTGGSSGYYYLMSTTGDRYRIFLDLFNISTFLVPRSRLPDLEESVLRRLYRFDE